MSRADEYESLLQDVTLWIDEAKQQANRSLHALLTITYWRIGRRIAEQEQQGQQRADYGERLMEQLAKDLSARYGRGFSRANVFQMRQLYLAYRHKVQTASGQFAPPLFCPGRITSGFSQFLIRQLASIMKQKPFGEAGQCVTWTAKSRLKLITASGANPLLLFPPSTRHRIVPRSIFGTHSFWNS